VSALFRSSCHVYGADDPSYRFVYQVVVPKSLAPKALVKVFEGEERVVLPPWDPMVSHPFESASSHTHLPRRALSLKSGMGNCVSYVIIIGHLCNSCTCKYINFICIELAMQSNITRESFGNAT
jgi:hypothetical protein